MPKQPAIPGLRDAMKKKVTRREQFLAEMEAVVPWLRLLALIAPHYPKAGPKGGRPPMPLETMLRVYFLQQWYALSDPMAEEMLYDSDAMRHFVGIELGDDRIPDETTILNFRHLLEKHDLTEQLFVAVNGHLADQPPAHARRGAGVDLVEQRRAEEVGAVHGRHEVVVRGVERPLIVGVGVVQANLRP